MKCKLSKLISQIVLIYKSIIWNTPVIDVNQADLKKMLVCRDPTYPLKQALPQNILLPFWESLFLSL